MVSGFLISPNDQERILSGEASEMRIWSKVGAATTGLKMLRTSWFIDMLLISSSPANERSEAVPGIHLKVQCAWVPGTPLRAPGDDGSDQLFSSSTLRPSERISL